MYTVRLAKTDDIPAISALRLAYLKDDFGGELPAKHEAEISAQLPAYFAAHLGRDCFAFTAELENGRLIALAILCVMEKPANLSFPNGKSGTVLSVYTEPAYRGMGCATALMTALLEQAKALHLDIINLSASDMGRPIYEKLGFTLAHSHFTEMKFVLHE